MGALAGVLDQWRPAFKRKASFLRARELALAGLLCQGRHTVTGMLCTAGRHSEDWSAAYRALRAFEPPGLFAPALAQTCAMLPPGAPLFASLDTTLLPKRGRHVPGARHRLDPLGPKFHPNFIWAQRFLQACALLPEAHGEPSRARGVPVALAHCPGLKKPGRKALAAMSPEQRRALREQLKEASAPAAAAAQVAALRARLDEVEGGRDRLLVCAVDNGLTNEAILRALPERTALIGRIRKDSALHEVPPASPPHRGRPPLYGKRLPAPDELRERRLLPVQEVAVEMGGKRRLLKVMDTGPVRWRPAGGRDVRLVIVLGWPHKASKNAPVAHRDPAYLICTDCSMQLRDVVQGYVWRWEIEVAFRDEKTVLGVGEAQVRDPKACEGAPALLVAAYAALVLAAERTRREHRRGSVALPKWRDGNPPDRETTQQMLGALRGEILRHELEEMNKQALAARKAPGRGANKSKATYVVAPIYTLK